MDWRTFYFDRLPKFVTILKKSLTEQLDKNNNLAIVDYINIFFEFYHMNNAFDYFEMFNPESDKMYISISLTSNESKVYIERDITIEGLDEEFQIQFELMIDLQATENKRRAHFEVERNHFGVFSNWEEGDLFFKDFQEKVLLSNLLLKLLNLNPKTIRIGINSDI